MYRIVEVRDRIRVPPAKLAGDVRSAVKESIADKFERVVDKMLGIVLSVVSVEEVGEGRIVPGDGGIYYDTTFRLLTFKPEMHEVVVGEIIDNTEFGSFVRIGPLDALVHISQLMDDYISYDEKNSIFTGRETKRTLKVGDLVRARVISISLGRAENKIGLTMRQPLLGSLSWIEEERRKKRG
jgi:DNA-directed RNA polymerase subunit E'